MKKKIVWSLACGAALFTALSAAALFGGCKPHETEKKDPPVYYSEFGAVGDGKTDDFAAIIKAHEYANENGRSVAADKGAKYYIGSHRATAVIKTDTDWQDAAFTIDDGKVSLEDRSYNVFEVQSDYQSYKVKLPNGYALKAGQKNVGLTFDTPVMLRVVNDNKKDYIRYGANQNGGSSRQEIILVDEQGNVDEDTPVLWDYAEVTQMTAYAVADKAVTVQGGVFTTITNKETVGTSYYARGINIKRSNTTVSGVEHYITGEPEAEADPPANPTSGKSSAPYTGFYVVNNANNVTIKDCVMTGHAAYRWMKPTGWVTQGTYDTQAFRSNDVSWVNCTQSNSIIDTKYWGVMASNFCKNLQMTGCSLSRFDAHQGVYNVTITDTVLGQTLNVIGAGTLYVENVSRLSGGQFIQLRTDYGSTWEGDVVLKDCTYTPEGEGCILNGQWTDWDFGYPCYLPKNITLDNFQTTTGEKCYVYPSVIANLNAATVDKSKNPYRVTEKLIIKNEKTPVELAANTSKFFATTAIERI